MMALLLMLMTGRGPGDVSNYLVRLRTIVDMNSPPPRRRELGSGLAFLEEKQDVIRQFRQKARVPVLSLNEIVSRRGFRELCASFLAAGSLEGSTSQPSGFQPVLPPPSTVQLTPAASSVKLTPGPDANAPNLTLRANTDPQVLQAKARPKASLAVTQDTNEPTPKAAEPPKLEASAGSAGEPQAMKKEKLEARTGSAGAVEAPNTGSSSAGPAGSTAAQAEAGAGVKRESVPAEGQGKKLKTDVAAEDAATSSDAVSAASMKELVTTLVTMHKKVAELSRLESERSSAAAAAFEEEVDYGCDEDDVDVDAATRVLTAQGPEAQQLLALLLQEQRRLAAQVAELTSRVNSAAPAPPDPTEEQLVEEAWAALRATDPVAAEGKLRALRPSAVAAMKDVAGVTPLHVAARERWLGLTGFLLEVAPGMACAITGERQPPHWTALMSLANQPKARGAVADREWEIVQLLLENMDTNAIMTRSGTGGTVLHMAVPKGNHVLAEQVLWHMYHVTGWDGVLTLLGIANNSGKSALDLAYRSHVQFANTLRNDWWAPSYVPPPAEDERGYQYRNRRNR